MRNILRNLRKSVNGLRKLYDTRTKCHYIDLYFSAMMRLLLTVVFLSTACRAYGGDTRSVKLGKVLAALEHAHDTHTAAKKLCGFESEPEGGWDHRERETRNLANAQPSPAVSRIVDVLDTLRTERRALLIDFARCAFKPDQTTAAESIVEAMNSLDEAANDVEDSIRDRAWNLEKAVEYYKAQPLP